ncbi:hypothetical protein CPB97_005438 [Podila verticillata]|nr:hypothetical protein CPB97_005438 [Podila verticillata]
MQGLETVTEIEKEIGIVDRVSGSKSTLVCSSPLMTVDYVNKIPVELWIHVCSYLYPSQLTRLSQTNHAMYEIVSNLGTWSMILQRVYPERLHRIIPGLPISKSHMLYVLASSFRICEQCFRYCAAGSEGRACLPWPTRVIPSSSDQDEHQPWTIRQCLACRRAHFAQYPEPIPVAVDQRYGIGTDLADRYGHEAVIAVAHDEILEAVMILEGDVLAQARVIFGGDIGLTARNQTVKDSLKKCKGRQYMYHSRMIIVAAGGPWVDPAERYLSMALEALYSG